MDSLPETKVCTKCHKEKPLNAFSKHSTAKYGVRPDCRNCRSEFRRFQYSQDPDATLKKNREWYSNNRDQAKEAMKEYRLANTAAHNARNRIWASNNKDKVTIKNKRWSSANPESRRETSRKWRANHPDAVKSMSRTRRARRKNVVSEKYTEQDILIRWGTNCHICGNAIDLTAPKSPGITGWELGLHLDHVIPLKEKGPDTIENVKPAHGLCNLKKAAS